MPSSCLHSCPSTVYINRFKEKILLKIHSYCIHKLEVGVGLASSHQKDLGDTLGNYRLSVPLLLTISIALCNYISGDKTFSLFQMLSKEQYLGAMFGFLSYLYSIIYFEVGSEISMDDLLGFLPGSLTEGLKMKKAREIKAGDQNVEPRRILFLTGPRVAGREIITKKLVSKMKATTGGNTEMNSKKKSRGLNFIKLITTEARIAENNPCRYVLLNDLELSQLKDLGDILYEGTEYGLLGDSWKVAISAEQIELSCTEDCFGVLQGPPEFLEPLKGLSGYQLSNMWISMQTKEQFIRRASDQIKTEILKRSAISFKERKKLTEEGVNEVSDLVNEAARDVSYFMAQAPFFEFTILADGDYNDTVDEILQILAPIL